MANVMIRTELNLSFTRYVPLKKRFLTPLVNAEVLGKHDYE